MPRHCCALRIDDHRQNPVQQPIGCRHPISEIFPQLRWWRRPADLRPGSLAAKSNTNKHHVVSFSPPGHFSVGVTALFEAPTQPPNGCPAGHPGPPNGSMSPSSGLGYQYTVFVTTPAPMTSTAAVTIAVAAAATATAIAVGPRVGLLRRRLLSLLGDAVFAGAEAAWVLMSSGPRAAPAPSTHASGGVAPAGHRSLISIVPAIKPQQQPMRGHETPTSTQICGHTV